MITSKLKRLALAMQEFEGWRTGAEQKPTAMEGSISYRNHNPLNLKASPFALGVRDGHAFFLDDETGLFAGIWDIHQKCKGLTSTGLTGESQLWQLIDTWADANEATRRAYKDHVYERTGLGALTLLKTLI